MCVIITLQTRITIYVYAEISGKEVPDGGSPALAKTMKNRFTVITGMLRFLESKREIRTLMLMLRRERESSCFVCPCPEI